MYACVYCLCVCVTLRVCVYVCVYMYVYIYIYIYYACVRMSLYEEASHSNTCFNIRVNEYALMLLKKVFTEQPQYFLICMRVCMYDIMCMYICTFVCIYV
jgi:hypothetical protein